MFRKRGEWDDYIKVGNEVEFEKVKKIIDNIGGMLVKKNVFYKITKTKFKKSKGFYIKSENGDDFYISSIEQKYIKSIRVVKC